MNIFSIFTFKKGFKELFSKENLSDLFNYAKTQILHYVNKSDLLGYEKKKKVDEAVLSYIDMKFTSSNCFVKFVINLIKAVVPTITQFIYDNLKSYIEGFTEAKVTNV